VDPAEARSASISPSLPIPGASQVRVFRRRTFMAGQSDPHLSIFSPSEVTNPFPSTLYRQKLSSSKGSEVGCNPISGPVLSVLQVEFVAEDEIVEIVPNIRMDALNMICVRLPPPPTSISFNSPSPTYSYISRCCCRRRAG